MFVFHAFGLCPTTIRQDGPSTMTPGLVCLSALHIILATVQFNVVIQLHDFIFYSRDSFGKINDTFKYCGIAIAYYSIIVETVWRRTEHVQFWRRVVQIKWDAAQRAHRHSDELHFAMPRRLVRQFGGMGLLVFLVEMTVVPLIISNQQSLNFWVIYSLTLLMSRVRHLQLIFYVDTLDRELEVLAVELGKVVNYSRFTTVSPAMADFIVSRIKWAQWNYSLIYDMSQDINEIFGWSQLANFLHSFVQILADLYWMYWRFYNENHYSFSREQTGLGVIGSCVNCFISGYAVCILPSLGIVVMVFSAANKFQLRVIFI